MLTLLKYDRIYVLFLIPLIIIGIWFNQLIDVSVTEFSFDSSPMPLYQLIIKVIPIGSVFSQILALILVALNGYSIIRVSGVNQLTSKGTFLHGILYVMFISLFPELRQFNPVLFSSIFMLFAANKLFLTYKEKITIKPFFEAGFLVGLGSLFYFNTIIFLLFVLISISILRVFNWREYIAPLLGLLSVYAFVLIWHLYFDDFNTFTAIIKENFIVKKDTSFLHLSNIIFFGYVGFIFLISIFLAFTGIVKKIITRKIYTQFLFWFFICLGMYAFIPSSGCEMIIFLGIPLSIFLTNYMLNINSSALSEIVFLTLVALYIFAQFNVNDFI